MNINKKEKIRTIRRKYFSKKLGKEVIKTYKYDYSKYVRNSGYKKRGKGLLLVGKKGRIYEDRLKALKASYEDITDIATIDKEIAYAIKHEEKITDKYLRSRLAKDKYMKMFINAGYTLEQAASELGVVEEELFNESNWEGGTFTSPRNDKKFTFQFTYYGSVWIDG